MWRDALCGCDYYDMNKQERETTSPPKQERETTSPPKQERETTSPPKQERVSG